MSAAELLRRYHDAASTLTTPSPEAGDGLPVEEQRRRLAVLACAFGIPVDAELLDATDAAMSWLHAKGSREGWRPETLEGIESERRWLHDHRRSLL